MMNSMFGNVWVPKHSDIKYLYVFMKNPDKSRICDIIGRLASTFQFIQGRDKVKRFDSGCVQKFILFVLNNIGYGDDATLSRHIFIQLLDILFGLFGSCATILPTIMRDSLHAMPENFQDISSFVIMNYNQRDILLDPDIIDFEKVQSCAKFLAMNESHIRPNHVVLQFYQRLKKYLVTFSCDSFDESQILFTILQDTKFVFESPDLLFTLTKYGKMNIIDLTKLKYFESILDNFEHCTHSWMIYLRILNFAFMESCMGDTTTSISLCTKVSTRILNACIYRLCDGMERDCEDTLKKINVISNLFKIVVIDSQSDKMDIDIVRLTLKKCRVDDKRLCYNAYYGAILDCLNIAEPENITDVCFEILLNATDRLISRDIQESEIKLLHHTFFTPNSNVNLIVEYTKRCKFSYQFEHEKVSMDMVYLVYEILKYKLSLLDRLYIEDLMLKITSLIQYGNLQIDSELHYGFMCKIILDSKIIYSEYVFKKILMHADDERFGEFLCTDASRYFKRCCSLILYDEQIVKITARLFILIRRIIARHPRFETQLLDNSDIIKRLVLSGKDCDMLSWIRDDKSRYYAERGHFAISILLQLKQNPLWYTITKDIQLSEPEDCCIICCTRERRIVFIPCGHVVACEQCSLTFDKCPTCRSHIRETNKVFF